MRPLSKFLILYFLISVSVFLFLEKSYAQGVPNGTHYVILTSPRFLNDAAASAALETIRQNRDFGGNQKASIVSTANIPAVNPGNPTDVEIKRYIKDYLYPAGVRYIFIVGERTDIPLYAYSSTSRSGVSDTAYTAIFTEGVPEIAIGRLTPHYPIDIANYVNNKFLRGGRTGNIIPDGWDKPFLHYDLGDVFYRKELLDPVWSPYWQPDEATGPFQQPQLINWINTHSWLFNTGHGQGVLALTALPDLPTTINPIWFMFGCQSANFGNPYHPSNSTYNISMRRGGYAAGFGAMQDHSFAGSARPFMKAIFQENIHRLGDILTWFQINNGYTSHLYTLIGDPYYFATSNQFRNQPRIYVDGGNLNTYNRVYLNNGTGSVDSVTFEIKSFNNAQWRVNVTYSDPAIQPFVTFSSLNSSQSHRFVANFQNLNNAPQRRFTIDLDIKDVSNGNILVKRSQISLDVTGINILDPSDFINLGNGVKKLPLGFYAMQSDHTIPSGETVILEQGLTIKSDNLTPYKLIVSAGAKILSQGTVESPIRLMPAQDDWNGTPVTLEINGDGTTNYIGEFDYTIIASQVITINNPRLKFNNVTFSSTNAWTYPVLLPNPLWGDMTQSVVDRLDGMNPGPIDPGHLNKLRVSYSLVPRDSNISGPGVIHDLPDMQSWTGKLNPTSLCINAGDPRRPVDPDGTRADIGAYFYDLRNAVVVPTMQPTIQQGLNAAVNSTTPVVIVEPGIYNENLSIPDGTRLMGRNENSRPMITATAHTGSLITPLGKATIENLILKKDGISRTGRIITNEGFHLSLRNIRFADNQNNQALIYSGNSASGNGSAFYTTGLDFTNNINNGSLINITLSNNYLQSWLNNSLFENNMKNDALISFMSLATFGGGDINLSGLTLKNNTGKLISHNSPADTNLPYPLVIRNSIFIENQGAVEASRHGHTAIEDSTFYNNGTVNGLIFQAKDQARMNIHNAILRNNTASFTIDPTAAVAVNYTNSNTSLPIPGTGNINADPLFKDPMNDDLHLLNGSPSIDSGDPATTVPANGGIRKDQGAFEVMQDITPPTTPIVQDEGSTTTRTNGLSASWTSDDPQTGIHGYEYQIREGSPTGTIVVNWTSTLSNTVNASINLTIGRTYFFAVKSINGAEQYSQIGYSDGIRVVIPNNPPVLQPIGDKIVNPGSLLNFQIRATDPDIGDILTYSAAPLPPGSIFTPSTQMFNWTPAQNQTGCYKINFRVQDRQGAFDEEKITIMVFNLDSKMVCTEQVLN